MHGEPAGGGNLHEGQKHREALCFSLDPSHHSTASRPLSFSPAEGAD